MIVKESLGDILKPKSQQEIASAVKNLSDKELIELAITKKSSEIMEFAIKRDLDQNLAGEILKWAAEYDCDLGEKVLETNEISQKDLVVAASKTLKSKDSSFINVLLKYPGFDPGYHSNQLLRWASSNGHTELVRILMNDTRVDPSDLENAALKGAEVYEHKDIIRILAQDKRVADKIKAKWDSKNKEMKEQDIKKYGIKESLGDILKPKTENEIYKAALAIEDPNDLMRKAINTIGNPELVKIAIERGADPNKISSDVTKVKNPEIIRILLTNPKIEVSPNSLVYKAVKMGLEDEIIALIKSKKLDPGKKQSVLLVWSVGFGRGKLVDALLKDKRVKPENEKESVTEALAIAIARGNNDLVKKLINDPRIDPSADFNRPVKVASQFGNIEMVEILLKDKRVDASTEDVSNNNDNFAIKSAAENGHNEIVAMLVKDPKVRSKLSKEEINKYESLSKIVKESLK